jgi:hypothetical protein
MYDPKPRRYPAEASQPATAIPDAQRRALERRNTLNEQQRNFSNPIPGPYFPRQRPPG